MVDADIRACSGHLRCLTLIEAGERGGAQGLACLVHADGLDRVAILVRVYSRGTEDQRIRED
jgi:hypothetical protein